MYISKRLPKCKTSVCTHTAVNAKGLCYDCTGRICVVEEFYKNKGYKNPVGVELEFFADGDEIHKLERSFYAGGDPSIRPPTGCRSMEGKYCNDSTKIQKQTIDICNYIATIDRAGVNSSCGLHVHLGVDGMPTLTSEDVRKDPNAPEKYEQAIKYQSCQLLDVMRPIEPSMEKMFQYRLNHACYVSKFLRSSNCMNKGKWISYRNSLGTIEVRIHEGTLNPVILHDWLSVCSSLQKLAKDAIHNKNTDRVKAAKAGNLLGVIRKNSPGERYIAKRTEFMSRSSSPGSYDTYTEFEESYN